MFVSVPRGRAGLMFGCALGALLSAAPALAQVTADRIWESWQANAAQLGVTVATDGVARAGNVLTASGVTLSQAVAPDFAFSLAMGDIRFTEQPDGTVAIALAPDFRLTLGPGAERFDEDRLVFLIRNDGLSILASAAAEAITYSYGAEAITLGVEELLVEGEPTDFLADLALRGLDGRYTVSTGPLLSIDSIVRAAELSVEVELVPPDDDGSLALSLSVADLESRSSGARLDLLAGLDPTRIGEAVAQGFGLSGGISYGPAEFSFDFTESGEQTYVAGETAGGSASVELTGERVAYAVASRETSYTLSGPDMPLPEVSFGFGDLEFAFSLPAAASAVPQPASALVRLVDLSLDEGIWAMIDPSASLPRDPATLILDLVGQVNWTFGLFDPRTAMADALPGELHALQLRELQVKAVGAELTGSGALIFDNSDTETYGGLPRPMGEIDLKLSGANALIDKLVALGLLPPDQAMGARMMLGFFARPGEGPDTLETTVEFTPDGGIVANGQQLQ